MSLVDRSGSFAAVLISVLLRGLVVALTSLSYPCIHGRQHGGMPPLEFENDDVICCSPVKYPKVFVRAFGARMRHT